MILRIRGGVVEFPRRPIVVGALSLRKNVEKGVDGQIAMARQMAADGADWLELCVHGATGEAGEAAGFGAFLERWSDEDGALPVVIRAGGEAVARLALGAGGVALCGGSDLGVGAAVRVCLDTGAALLLTHVFNGSGASGPQSAREAFVRSVASFFDEGLTLVAAAGLSVDAVMLDAGITPEGVPGGFVQREMMERLGRPWCASVSGRRDAGQIFEKEGPSTEDAAVVAGIVQGVQMGAHLFRVDNPRSVRAAGYAVRTIAAVLGGVGC
jgi:dihydropteroate synthase